MHDSAQIFAVKLSAWQSEIGAIREWYQREHSNWVALPGERSKWWMWNSVNEIAKNTVVHIQTYLERMAKGILCCYDKYKHLWLSDLSIDLHGFAIVWQYSDLCS